MHFASDNTSPAHPAILEAMAEANSGRSAAYGADALTRRAEAALRDLFEAPEARVYLVAAGTAANAILLSSLAKPWETVFAARTAHIEEDECGAVPFMTGGGTITLVDGRDGKIDADALGQAMGALGGRDVHGHAPGPVSLTQATEKGTLYRPDELAEIATRTKGAGVPLHMDGARFANGVAALDVSPADLTWRAGVDAISFGGTKNGCVGLEAMVIFDPELAPDIERHRMRSGHLLSKQRYLAAQLLAYLEEGLWLDLARQANQSAAHLAKGLSGKNELRLLYPAEANILFFDAPRGLHRRLFAAGAEYHLWSGPLDGGPEDDWLTARLVCDWSIDKGDIDRFLDLL
ncbi:MAG: beta-eliminating lyase-related protein [Pseudomonadota bacterium]